MNDITLEVIGTNVLVIESTNKQLVGILGKIIDETRHMLTLDTKFGKKLIPKNTSKFKISKNNKTIILTGTQLSKHPYERLEVLN